MRSFKLSLVAALVAGSFSLIDAKSLEEAIKDVDVSGSFRYRYDSFSQKSTETGSIEDYSDMQRHKFRASLTTGVGLGDGFKAVGTLNYNPDDEGDAGFAYRDKQNALQGQGANTKRQVFLQEAYLQYDNADFGTTILLGRQRLNTIWTDNDRLSGSSGMKAQILNTALVGTTLTAFAVDSVDDDGDFAGAGVNDTVGQFTDLKEGIFKYNIYGAAALFDFSEQTGISASAWFAHVPNRINLYAATLGYSLPLGEGASWSIEAQYLGNSVDDFLKRRGADAGNLYTVAGTLEIAGFDGTLGYTAYGKENALTVNVLEDMGDIITAGEEIQNLDGSSLHGSTGKNQFGFVSAGYTINDFRVGADYVYGSTKVAQGTSAGSAGKKQEIVGRLEYSYTDNLVFSGFYSYVTHKANSFKNDLKQNNIRFEARYDF